MRSRLVLSLSLLLPAMGVAHAAGLPVLVPPVDGPVVHHFEPPSSRFGPGHRGIDFSAPEGSPVRAAASGTVTFAGPVAGSPSVTIDHGGGYSTTYSVLARIDVQTGDSVRAGGVIGTSNVPHAGGAPGLHFGVKRDDEYVDPQALLVAVDPSAAIRLAPVEEVPLASIGIDATLPTDILRARECTLRYDVRQASAPPNDNIAVAIAGINSSSHHADLFEAPPELLGYAPGDVYRFSYRGPRGPRLHQAYGPRDTWKDIRASARQLAGSLREIRRLHPGRGVDLIAHSQGGLVARAFLELIADPTDDSLPAVEHLVTFATPHEGAPLAREAVELKDGLGYAHFAGRALSAAADRTGAFPDLFAPSVEQLAPGSPLMDELSARDSLFGTRYLSLAAPADLIVPATQTNVEGAVERTVRFDWAPNQHSTIVHSTQGRGMAHAFLRDAPDPCLGSSEGWGSLFGRAIATGESVVADGVRAATSLLPGAEAATATHAGARLAGSGVTSDALSRIAALVGKARR